MPVNELMSELGYEYHANHLESMMDFEPGTVYQLVAMARKKENPEISRNTEWMFREVVSEPDDILYNIKKLSHETQVYPGGKFRLYATVNRRDAFKAQGLLRERMNKWTEGVYHGDDEILQKFERVGSEFRSCLQDPGCRDQSRFLVDVDSTNTYDIVEVIDELGEIGVERHYAIHTPNGFHVVTGGFDMRQFDVDAPVEIKPDALAFVCYL